jgi:uncharacterized cupredoxin-like copper-binding protein
VAFRLKAFCGPAAAIASLLVLAGAMSGCGGTASSKGVRVVDVVERDFKISLSENHLFAGPVVFQADNKGPDAHELIVVRDNGRLPLRPDGMTVNEEGLEKQIVGALEPGPSGDIRDLKVDLKPGRYVLLCNMYGHFMGGMHSTIEVT